MSAVGTPRKLVIDGVTYDVKADTNITFNASIYENEGIATSGRTLQKKTKRVPTKESVTVAADPSEVDELKSKSESLASKTFAVEYADGSTYRATGQLNFESWESEEGTATLVLIPDRDWTLFPA
ncbi:MAG: hypothetical protein EHM48_00015 [Planctomycetaceae bacterium]|jgi:hypothetical protein|nr:MAG: hypothetical protein EHM48_00015 [Planctomycetaceae bacterium]